MHLLLEGDVGVGAGEIERNGDHLLLRTIVEPSDRVRGERRRSSRCGEHVARGLRLQKVLLPVVEDTQEAGVHKCVRKQPVPRVGRHRPCYRSALIGNAIRPAGSSAGSSKDPGSK